MVYVIVIIAAIFIGTYLYDRYNKAGTSGEDYAGEDHSSSSGIGVYPSANPAYEMPVPLRNIHPSQDSFWDSVDFYVRLGNACYDMTHNAYVVSAAVYNDGRFSVDFFDIDSANTLLPMMDSRDMNRHIEGTDKDGSVLYKSLYNMKQTLENDAPEADVQVYESADNKAATIRWKGFYE